MSSEEAGHVSLMKATPTSGKGTLGTWWFLRQARARLDKTEHINRSQGQGLLGFRTGLFVPWIAHLRHAPSRLLQMLANRLLLAITPDASLRLNPKFP